MFDRLDFVGISNGDIRVRVCLVLGTACRALFKFPVGEEVHSPEYEAYYFEHEIEKSSYLIGCLPSLKGSRVLEIGCGYGGMLEALAREFAAAEGIDVDERKVTFARRQGMSARVADAEALFYSDVIFDFVVSDSVIEHVPDIKVALAEAYRVLRPGGLFVGLWGPSWLTYNGPHLVKSIGFPWVQLFFSDRTILRSLERLKQERRFPQSYLDYKIADFQTMGRTTRRELRCAAREVGFDILQETSYSPRRVKHLLSRLPYLDELLAGDLTVELRKPA